MVEIGTRCKEGIPRLYELKGLSSVSLLHMDCKCIMFQSVMHISMIEYICTYIYIHTYVCMDICDLVTLPIQ